jgi:hypothetical protein
MLKLLFILYHFPYAHAIFVLLLHVIVVTLKKLDGSSVQVQPTRKRKKPGQGITPKFESLRQHQLAGELWERGSSN